ncbi:MULTISPECIES: hypothetical protein [unclassified Rhizobium]|uniref:hypothetical protein n=1 Tax=unclassified Rhizobium TaxID=2613769 RepID=UPI001ADA9B74|nr:MULTISPECIES: hypothetical protein [unclassified Rhizobium]MBO9097191.1 hypothetical protein [Rhizobium sp. L58/93]MBO9133957.1 hypothetical protein [Rhizobium sp. B209b/85]MBO9167429.1 hypothetical protein [Rhizobium sp. L245/93]MBO9183388.1 hypothetical protein [Rhizobium sp. E27B/91]QXZ83726.1 hypothetical protein J5287_17095 [Rhizobium sp. K1/93]
MSPSRPKDAGIPPTTHTALIKDPVSMWEKLVWDVEVFRDIQCSYPDERQPLAYAAINVSIASWSLGQWVQSAKKRAARDKREEFSDTLFWANLHQMIPEQAMCDAIANTSKHSRYEARDWQGGEVRIDWVEGNEDVPSGWQFSHVHSGTNVAKLAQNTFQSLCNNWWRYLVAHGHTEDELRTPRFLNNKIARIFGDRPLEVGEAKG